MFSNAQQRRLERELSNIRQDPPEKCTAQPLEGDISKWTATIEGPDDTPYQNGIFKLNITIPDRYPTQPPTVKFASKIYHPNIDADSGFIGLNILHEAWSPVLTISTILLSLRAFLSSPDPTDAVAPEIAHQYVMRREEYNETAERWTKEFANSGLQG